MADITMCTGNGCPFTDECYRHNAPCNKKWQSYFAEVPYKNGRCEMFWQDDKEEESE